MQSADSNTEILRPVTDEHEPMPLQDEIIGDPETWWGRYATSLTSMPIDTRNIIADDASYIARRAVPMLDGIIDQSAFGSTRVRTGIVVGSVQSGKTASMLGVAAILLDQGIEILVILAGTRVALWLQTYERLLIQLDGSSVADAWMRNGTRVLVPQPEDILRESDRMDPVSYLRGARLKVRQALNSGKPIIFVVPKEDDHLLALSRFLQSELVVTLGDKAPTRMVVLDDEADDASILDAGDGARITPQFIQKLWSGDRHAPSTQSLNLYASYIAYTATPQANYLQQSHNPLAPRDFHASLRVPFDRGDRIPRNVTYRERIGLTSYYCGGELYYERLRGIPGDPCVSYPFPEPHLDEAVTRPTSYDAVRWEMIGAALRSYFVAGAIRMLLDDRRFSNVPSFGVDRDELINTLPQTHSMLYHPSALKSDHFEGAADISRWCRSLPGDEIKCILPRDADGEMMLSISEEGLLSRLEAEEDKWRVLLSSYAATAVALSCFPGGGTLSRTAILWDEVRKILIDEVFPNVKLRVLNSDPRADDRPGFSPTRSDSHAGLWLAPRDLYTIFVAGNILSRGLTVEGLCTSLFMRGAREPAADTQMQMQRWFGYRGKHLSFCRLIVFADQLQLFRQYHANDIALKTELLNHMDGSTIPFADGVLVLQGDSFRATSKVDSRKLPLHPGPTPAIRLIEPANGEYYNENIRHVQRQLEERPWDYLNYPVSAQRGLICKKPLSMLEVAEFLEGFRYSNHDPALELDLSKRWSNLQRMLGLTGTLFNPPGRRPGLMAVDPSACPYSIAAYLRLWNIALTRHDMPGMHPTDKSGLPWNMLNLLAYRNSAPSFYLGIRFGSAENTKILNYNGENFPMMVRGVSSHREYLLDALWGSRNPGERWKGDQAFDYHYIDPANAPRILIDGAWRGRGQPGLVLLHPVIDPAAKIETIAVGLVLPHGGPDHIAALRVRGAYDE